MHSHGGMGFCGHFSITAPGGLQIKTSLYIIINLYNILYIILILYNNIIIYIILYRIIIQSYIIIILKVYVVSFLGWKRHQALEIHKEVWSLESKCREHCRKHVLKGGTESKSDEDQWRKQFPAGCKALLVGQLGVAVWQWQGSRDVGTPASACPFPRGFRTSAGPRRARLLWEQGRGQQGRGQQGRGQQGSFHAQDRAPGSDTRWKHTAASPGASALPESLLSPARSQLFAQHSPYKAAHLLQARGRFSFRLEKPPCWAGTFTP